MSDASQPQETLGQRLVQIRGARSQDDFARLLGIGRATLQRYEAGQRSIDSDLMGRLWVLFRVDPLWLITGMSSTDKAWGWGGAQKEAQTLNFLSQLDPRTRDSFVNLLECVASRGSNDEGKK